MYIIKLVSHLCAISVTVTNLLNTIWTTKRNEWGMLKREDRKVNVALDLEMVKKKQH